MPDNIKGRRDAVVAPCWGKVRNDVLAQLQPNERPSARWKSLDGVTGRPRRKPLARYSTIEGALRSPGPAHGFLGRF